MAAAPGLAVGQSPLASPELALVDAALAAELRLSLRPVEDSWLRPARLEQVPAAFVEDARVQWDPADEVGEAESRDVHQLDDDYIVDVDDYIVEVVEHTPEQTQRTSSHYPVLPAPEPDEEAIEETADAALRQIRERMTDESPARERKLRRRFILGSGASAVCTLGVLAVDLQFHVAQLPGWLGF